MTGSCVYEEAARRNHVAWPSRCTVSVKSRFTPSQITLFHLDCCYPRLPSSLSISRHLYSDCTLLVPQCVSCSHINPLNTKRRLLYLKTQFVPRSKHFSSRLNQSAYAVSGTSRCLFPDKYKIHKYSVGRAYSCWMLNCWCITWPVGFKRLTETAYVNFQAFTAGISQIIF